MSTVGADGSLRDAYREGGIVEVPRRKKKGKEHASTGFSAAAMRALGARMLTFYFRAPIKAFFKPRIDYMGYARAINPSVQGGAAWSWRMTSPALLYNAVRHHGWTFIPNQFLPPLIANTAVGAVLYTAYLQSLCYMHEPSSISTKRVYPPPPPSISFSAGFVAGSIQSLLAAPVDALQTRFQAKEMMEGKYTNMWQYGWRKTREIGARGIMAGWGLSFVKDSLGAGVFFATFETVKSQAFYSFVSTWYGDWAKLSAVQREAISAQRAASGRPEIRPHYMVEPAFLLLAGVAASVAQAVIQHPLSRLQEIHHGRLEWIDSHDHHKPGERKKRALRLYAAAYRKTIRHVLVVARRNGGLTRWLYRDFFMSTIRQVPSTSAGLIVFEIIRRKYGNDDEAVRIPKNGYEIVLI
ncbi:mitochondrial carrier [Lecanosticta acicola]|uniref:Mitochondrial carrier n=1 Tax=Lecanosticta acicola TaxID=111012 RepID=A0AAI8W2D6_9PEZI|nr:mitochondrial carrier [Lecanosticta acicola]